MTSVSMGTEVGVRSSGPIVWVRRADKNCELMELSNGVMERALPGVAWCLGGVVCVAGWEAERAMPCCKAPLC